MRKYRRQSISMIADKVNNNEYTREQVFYDESDTKTEEFGKKRLDLQKTPGESIMLSLGRFFLRKTAFLRIHQMLLLSVLRSEKGFERNRFQSVEKLKAETAQSINRVPSDELLHCLDNERRYIDKEGEYVERNNCPIKLCLQ